MPRLVILSDTHGQHDRIAVPDGDILIHAGDFCRFGRLGDIGVFNAWLATLPHKVKIVIAGNHELPLEDMPEPARGLLTDCVYLQDQSHEAFGLKFYGSPWQPRFFDWAFNANPDKLREVWARIPDDTDVLITHSAPSGILSASKELRECGCGELRARLENISPKLHVFGHIHESYGRLERNGTTHINASICNADYEPVNPPVIIDL